ncbi:MAG: helix-turn-helix domain-containing protein, partial [Planctomycetes bacterium]|nr:helix-turn-helix domain-containing protein [Planctomycetota bacterium]
MADKDKLANRRVKVLKKAERLGNVSKACRRSGIDRNSFYKYKKRHKKHGLKGLKNLSCTPHSHPRATPPEIVKKILDLSSRNPNLRCVDILSILRWQCISISF